MKAFKFYANDYFYAYSGETEEEAKNTMLEEMGETQIDNVEEIPESEWDKPMISVYEDNDLEGDPFMVCIIDLISDTSEMLFTNDYSMF